MSPLTTPFDDFVADAVLWINQPWYVWVAAVGVVVVIAASVVFVKWRRSVNARTPHYRRHG